MVRNNDNAIQYSFRLNLKNADHLLVNQTLRNLNSDIYGSKSNFIIDCILNQVKGSNRKNGVSSEKSWFVTRKELDELKETMEKSLKTELTEYFMKTLLQVLAQGGNRSLEINRSIDIDEKNTDNDKYKEDI